MEHIVPLAAGGTDDLNNLALACFRCNLSKGTAQAVQLHPGGEKVRLFNPRTDDWNACFDFVLASEREAVRIVANNDVGRAAVTRLRMNAPHAVRARWLWFLTYAFDSELRSE